MQKAINQNRSEKVQENLGHKDLEQKMHDHGLTEVPTASRVLPFGRISPLTHHLLKALIFVAIEQNLVCPARVSQYLRPRFTKYTSRQCHETGTI